ncbi:MAG: hypothetical protein ACP5D6_11615, partial [Kosmotogaceae bacterium]
MSSVNFSIDLEIKHDIKKANKKVTIIIKPIKNKDVDLKPSIPPIIPIGINEIAIHINIKRVLNLVLSPPFYHEL